MGICGAPRSTYCARLADAADRRALLVEVLSFTLPPKSLKPAMAIVLTTPGDSDVLHHVGAARVPVQACEHLPHLRHDPDPFLLHERLRLRHRHQQKELTDPEAQIKSVPATATANATIRPTAPTRTMYSVSTAPRVSAWNARALATEPPIVAAVHILSQAIFEPCCSFSVTAEKEASSGGEGGRGRPSPVDLSSLRGPIVRQFWRAVPSERHLTGEKTLPAGGEVRRHGDKAPLRRRNARRHGDKAPLRRRNVRRHATRRLSAAAT